MTRRVVVVGNGMAGSRFVQELLERDLDRCFEVTVVADEAGGSYNRVQLSNVLAGTVRPSDIVLAGPQWYAANGVRLLDGRTAVRVLRASRGVVLDDATTLGYDVLVLATGSDAVIPRLDGLYRDGGLLPGVVAFRTLDDCRHIDRLASSARRAVVLGAGVLGLEAARGLAGRGLHVTLVQRGERLMERQLDTVAARVLARRVRDLGVEIVGNGAVRAVHGGDSFGGVLLADGTKIDADLLVLCCGVRPRVDLARDAGFEVADGVVVNDRLQTISDTDVFAIGECAQHRGRTYGLVAPAWEQARVAAAALADPSTPLRYEGSRDVTRLKAADLELAAMGDSSSDGEDDVCFVDGGRGVYQKLVVRDGRLVGAILLGDTRTVGTVTQLFDRGAEVPADPAGLLIARRTTSVPTVQSPTSLPGRATICHCNGVTKAGICQAWQDGARSVDEIASRTRATTGCGTCRDTVDGLVSWLDASDPQTPQPVEAERPAVMTA